MIIQIYNWSIVISAIMIYFVFVLDSSDDEVVLVDKKLAFLLTIVPVVNTIVILYFIQCYILIPLKRYVIRKYIWYKVNKLIRKYNSRNKQNKIKL